MERYVASYEAPEWVKKLPSHEDRIRYYIEKANKELPVWTFLEKLDTEMSPEELRDEIEIIQDDIKHVETAIKVLESNELVNLGVELEKIYNSIRLSMAYRIAIMTKQARRDYMGNRKRDNDEMEKAKQQERTIAEKGYEIEKTIRLVCEQVGVDPRPHLKVSSIMGRTL